MREGAAGGPLSTAAWHICQIRGISPAHEPGIREDSDSHLSHEGRRAPLKKLSLCLFSKHVTWSYKKKEECTVNKLCVVHKSLDETRQ